MHYFSALFYYFMHYHSAFLLYFSTHTLIDTVDEFVKDGGEQIFIDEIHKYENWSRELKLIYDSHPDLKVGYWRYTWLRKGGESIS